MPRENTNALWLLKHQLTLQVQQDGASVRTSNPVCVADASANGTPTPLLLWPKCSRLELSLLRSVTIPAYNPLKLKKISSLTSFKHTECDKLTGQLRAVSLLVHGKP